MTHNIQDAISNLFHDCGRKYRVEQNNAFTATVTFDGDEPFNLHNTGIYTPIEYENKARHKASDRLLNLSKQCPVVILRNANIDDSRYGCSYNFDRTSGCHEEFNQGVPPDLFHRDILSLKNVYPASLLIDQNARGRHSHTCFTPEKSMQKALGTLLTNTNDIEEDDAILIHHLLMENYEITHDIGVDIKDTIKEFYSRSISKRKSMTSEWSVLHAKPAILHLVNDILDLIPENEKTVLSWEKGQHQIVLSSNLSEIVHGRDFDSRDKEQHLEALDLL